MPVLKTIFRKANAARARLARYRVLAASQFQVTFIHEGQILLRLPTVSAWNAFWGTNKTVTNNFLYYHRPHAEVLLRKIIHQLYSQKYIPATESVIDVGCWIGDNTLVWAKNLTEAARVIAIDPSPDNLTYGKTLADINTIKNITWIEAVCSDREGSRLGFEGSLDHTRFDENASEGSVLVSTTLDKIIADAGYPGIGLIHVDVEGFELKVLKGAVNIIEKNKPVILFEQHISAEDCIEVSDFLRALNYRVFMINEVIPGCALDCRNFIALHKTHELPAIKEFPQQDARSLGIFSAMPGPPLIEI